MRYIQLGMEKEYGVLAENTTFLSVQGDCSLDVPDSPFIEVPNMQETPTTAVKGFYVPEGDLEVGLDLQTAHILLYLCFGGYYYDSEHNTHIIYSSPGTEVPSFTVGVGKENRAGKDGFEHLFNGCVVESATLDLSDDLAMLKMTLKARIDTLDSIKEFVDIPDYYPLAFYNFSAYLDEVNVSPDTSSFSLELNNNLEEENGKGLASMFPYFIPSSGKDISISSDVAFQGDKYLKMFWGAGKDEKGPTDRVVFFKYLLKGKDRLDNEIEVLCPKSYFDSVSQPIEGKEAIKHEATINVLKGSTEVLTGKKIGTSIIIKIKNNEKPLDIDTLNNY